MKKILICNVPMGNKSKLVYPCRDLSLPTSDKAYTYPSLSFLEKTIESSDELKVILLAKKSEYSDWERNVEIFKEDLINANAENIKVDFSVIDTDFSEEQSVHEELMKKIIDEIEEKTKIIADVTYGPKDLPLIVFAALGFAEKFLGCSIDNIIYGQSDFDKDGRPQNPRICDFIPLYSLCSLTGTINCHDADKARKMLNTLLSL